MADAIAELKFCNSANGGMQCFPLSTYALDGKIRRDNITDWALGRRSQAKYGPDVTKQDIFHYAYGLLHPPQYRERYKENLKRELPRIPLVDPPLRSAGILPRRGGLDAEPTVDAPGPPIVGGSQRSREVGSRPSSPSVNEVLTLGGIPGEAFEYKLGSRSALEWGIDQYRVSTDRRSGIVSDPNRADDPEYIARLLRRVVTVSVETARLVARLPPVVAEVEKSEDTG